MRGRRTQKNRITPETVLVRDNEDINKLVNVIVAKVNSISAAQKTRTGNTIRRGIVKTQDIRMGNNKKLIVDFGGMSPDVQDLVAVGLSKHDEIKGMKNTIQIKDGPFRYSAECLSKKIFGEHK